MTIADENRKKKLEFDDNLMKRKQSKSCEYPVKTPCEEDPYMWNMLMENRNKLRAWNYFCIVSIAIDQYEIRKNVCIEQQKTHFFRLDRFLNFIEFCFFFVGSGTSANWKNIIIISNFDNICWISASLLCSIQQQNQKHVAIKITLGIHI